MLESTIRIRNGILGRGYRWLIKPALFQLNPERVHEFMTTSGQVLGALSLTRWANQLAFGGYSHKMLGQNINGLNLTNPIGLSAGFDYEAKLPLLLPSLSFGFGTVGTFTARPYEGNPQPRLGRLPRSRSLLVNKGYKNIGVERLGEKWGNTVFQVPIGLSLGRSNFSDIDTPQKAVQDIVHAFTLAEQSSLQHAYYELNISCPNLISQPELETCFYDSGNLGELVSEIEALNISRPVWVKMPITISDQEAIDLLKTLEKHSSITAVIFGNLQKDRDHPSFDRWEVERAGRGNFSGSPTYQRSNELISLAYQHFGQRFTVVGTGGIFSAEDAYTKIQLGASLVQLITGMIYQGPQLISEINQGLVRLLQRDGFHSITEAVGRK